MIRKLVYGVLSSMILALALSTAGIGQTSPSKDFANIKISNFGKMDDRFYRGSQPKKKEFAALKALGIHTVIDLQADPKDFEKSEVEALGMKYVNIPMTDKEYPSDANIAAFLKTVDDKETGVFYVHCAGGRHRTGDVGAVYRFTKYGWDYDKVFQEMKNYDFYTSWGHQRMKDFVDDYAKKMETQKSTAATTVK